MLGVAGDACGVAVSPMGVDFVFYAAMPVAQLVRMQPETCFFGDFAQGSLKRGFVGRVQAACDGLPKAVGVEAVKQKYVACVVVQQDKHGDGDFFGHGGVVGLRQPESGVSEAGRVFRLPILWLAVYGLGGQAWFIWLGFGLATSRCCSIGLLNLLSFEDGGFVNYWRQPETWFGVVQSKLMWRW